MRTIPASLAGDHALDILRKNRHGAVLSSHSSGLYCRLDDGSVLLIHEEEIGVIPFGLGCPLSSSGAFDAKALPGGTPAINHIGARQLQLGEVTFAYSPSPPPPLLFPWEFAHPIRERLRSGLETAASFLACSREGGVAASFMRRRDALFSGRPTPSPLRNIWEEAIWMPFQNLVAYLQGVDGTGGPDEVLAALIGLGAGLTPLADDILCGLLAAGFVLESPFPCSALNRLRRDVAPIIDRRALDATTEQSAAFLRTAAVGGRFGVIDALVAAMYTPDGAGLDAALTRLMAIGHSSGSGFVLGVLCAVSLAAQK